MQKLLGHESYCEPILPVTLARASDRLSFAARPVYCLDKVGRPTLFAQEIHPNPRVLMMQSPLRCRTSIIHFVLVQASFSLSMGRTRLAAGLTSSKILFSPSFRASFNH